MPARTKRKKQEAQVLVCSAHAWNVAAFSLDGLMEHDTELYTTVCYVSEREMKRIVLDRKNSLFVGNARGGRTAAILASLTSTCRRHDVDPQLYLTVADQPANATQQPTGPVAARPVEDPSHRSTRMLTTDRPANPITNGRYPVGRGRHCREVQNGDLRQAGSHR